MRMHGKPISTAKLDMQAAEWARDKYFNEHWSQRRIAEKLGVTTQTIGRIVRNESWKNFDDPFREDDMSPPAGDPTPEEAAAIQASEAKFRKMMEATKIGVPDPKSDEIRKRLARAIELEQAKDPDLIAERKAKQALDSFNDDKPDGETK